MAAIRCECVDAVEFLARASALLDQKPALHQQIIGRATACLTDPSICLLFLIQEVCSADVVGAVAFVFRRGTGRATDRATGAFVAGSIPDSTAEVLLCQLEESTLLRLSALPTVVGPADAAEAFARGYAARFGAEVVAGQVLEAMVLTSPPTESAVGGRLVCPTGILDQPLLRTLTRWHGHFQVDVGMAAPSPDEELEAFLVSKAAAGDLFVWLDEEDCPVAVAASMCQIGDSGRQLGFVFTDRKRRGQGYGNALVRAVCSQWLQTARFVTLTADVASESSSVDLYTKIGFRGEGQQLSFRIKRKVAADDNDSSM